MEHTTFIDDVYAINIGGGCDGRYIGISDELIVLYNNLDEFFEAVPDNKPFIEL